MENKNYIWKRFRFSRVHIIVFAAIIFMFVAASAGWYFFVHLPQKKHEAVLAAEQKKLEEDIASVHDYYINNLAGGGLGSFNDLVLEVYKSEVDMDFSGYYMDIFSCQKGGCKLGFKLKNDHIFNAKKINFFGNEYQPNFSGNEMNYSGLESKLNGNVVYEAYKHGKDIDLPDCTTLLNYIYTFNSLYTDDKSHESFLITSRPTSSVINTEEALGGKIKYYGLMTGLWTVSGNDMLYLKNFLAKQSFHDAFIVNNFESSKNTFKVSGVMVCKKGI